MWWGTPGNKAPPMFSSSNIPQRWQKLLLCVVLLSDAHSLLFFPLHLPPWQWHSEIPWDRSNGLEKINWTFHTVLVSPWGLFQHSCNHRWVSWEAQSPFACESRTEKGRNLTFIAFLKCARHNTMLSHVAPPPQQICEAFTVKGFIYS